jgi:hypothetical protein
MVVWPSSLIGWAILIAESMMTAMGMLYLNPHVRFLDATLEVPFVTLTNESHCRFTMPTAKM